MDRPRLAALSAHYRQALLDDVIPFWLRHSLDRELGGYLNCLDRDGSAYDTDKAVWLQARQVWMLSKLYNEVERRPEWLDAARLGYTFLLDHAFDADGRMFYSLTRNGRPLRKRRYLFSETFGIIACSEFYRATGDERALQRARGTYRLVIDLYRTPGSLPPKVIPETRATKSLAMPMILLATTQELRLVDSDPLYDEVVEDALYQIRHHFLKRDEQALHETVGPHGERLDSPAGRLVNPGHAIEAAWFLLREADARQDAALQADALSVLGWSLDWGWDPIHGGLLSFVDIESRPPEQLEWDMKMWWPHSEALIANLMAYQRTGDARWAEWFQRVHAWAWEHLADPQHGEWYGYLHRDGTVSLPVKGSMWKGCFHLPRCLWLCWGMLQELQV